MEPQKTNKHIKRYYLVPPTSWEPYNRRLKLNTPPSAQNVYNADERIDRVLEMNIPNHEKKQMLVEAMQMYGKFKNVNDMRKQATGKSDNVVAPNIPQDKPQAAPAVNGDVPADAPETPMRAPDIVNDEEPPAPPVPAKKRKLSPVKSTPADHLPTARATTSTGGPTAPTAVPTTTAHGDNSAAMATKAQKASRVGPATDAEAKNTFWAKIPQLGVRSGVSTRSRNKPA